MKKPTRSFVDTHAHLTFSDFKEDLDGVISRAAIAGVTIIVTIGSGEGLEATEQAVKLAQKYPGVYATVGIHPHDAGILDSGVMARIKELASNEKVVAVGEIGLDYHHGNHPVHVQRRCYEEMLLLAQELNLPVSIHDREAHEDCIFAIRHLYANSMGGVFHCFSGDRQVATDVLDLGFYVSIPGVITFGKNVELLRDVVAFVPIERLVLETDAPFLAPEPYRGKRNEPAYIPHIAEAIASIKKLSVEDVARITTQNARRLYRLPSFVPEPRIAYSIRNSLYLNITNRCNLACTFCPKRSGDFEVKGHNLKLKNEPDIEDIFRAMGDPGSFSEVVFCGYGEPTIRLELLKEVAREIKARGVRVRLNTDGLANLIYDRNVLPEFKDLVDEITVSINAPDAKSYEGICPSKWGVKAFDAVKEFIREAKKYIPKVTASVVTCPGVDVERTRHLVEEELGVSFRVREYQELG